MAGKDSRRIPRIQLSRRAILLLTNREIRGRLRAAARFAQATPRPLRILVRDLYQAVERDYVVNGRKSLKDLQGRWRKRLEPAFGDLPVANLTIAHVSAYIEERQKAKAANATINRELAELRRCVILAVQTGVLKERPCYFKLLRERNVRQGHLKDEEYPKLAQSTREVGLWLHAMFEVAFVHGWRKRELLTRRVRHVDLVERTLSLDYGETKNDRPKRARLLPAVFELIKKCCAGKTPDDYLFTRSNDWMGRRAKTAEIHDFRKAWRWACCAAGVGRMVCKDCRKAGDEVTVSENRCPKCASKKKVYVGLLFHDLRRSATGNLMRDGCTEKQAMAVTGHVTSSVFKRYDIVDAAQERETANKMERGAALRGICAEPLDAPSQLQLPFGDSPRKPADQEPAAICSKPGCGENLHSSNTSGYCKKHTIVASRKAMSEKLRTCEFQGEGCLGEFNPTMPAQKNCPVCHQAAKRARARAHHAEHPPRKPVRSDRSNDSKKKALPAAGDPIPA